MESSIIISNLAEHNSGFLTLISIIVGAVISVVIYYLSSLNKKPKRKKITFGKFNTSSAFSDPYNMKILDVTYSIEICIANSTGQDLAIYSTEVFNEESKFKFKCSNGDILENNTNNTLVVSYEGNSATPRSIVIKTSIAKYEVYYDGKFTILE